MATWQVDLDLLPRKQLLTVFGEMPSVLTEDLREAAATWNEQLLPADCTSRISKLLPEDKSWCPGIRMWGDEDGNRISLEHDDAGYPNAIFIRIDARDTSNRFLEGIVELANSIDAVFLAIEDLKIVEPRLELLVQQMKRSNGSRFVANPREFLESLKEWEN